MHVRSQMVCAWVGVIALGCVLAGFLCADFIPPPKSSWTAERLADFYGSDTDLKRAGMIVMVFGATGFAALVAGMSNALLRIPGARTMALLQVVAGAVGTACLLLFAILLSVAVFRPDRSPDVTQALHDAGWFMAFISAPPFALQAAAIAGAVIGDAGPDPVFPRWFGYTNAAIGAMLLPGVLLLAFKTGPFAYHGAISFWLPLADFGAWMLLMAWGIVHAARSEAAATPA